MSTPCAKKVSQAHGIPESVADNLLARMKNMAKLRADANKMSVDMALREIAGEIRAEDSAMQRVKARNQLLSIRAKRNVKQFVARFKTIGEGLLAFLEGSNKVIQGARNSVDYQAKALHGQYFGRMVAELEEAGVLKEFTSGEHTQDIYREMGAFQTGKTKQSVTGNETAFKIASTLDNITKELVARQNRAGAFIRDIPGYIIRQTHDQDAIRAAGKNLSESFKAWYDFTLPLLDVAKTFKGADPLKVAKLIHEGLYSGIHGKARLEEDVMGTTIIGALADRVSESRVLHFKDADSAYKYNQAFGTKDFKEAIMADIHQRARSIALMENLGPNPELTLDHIIRELQEEYRTHENAAEHVDSLRDWRIKAAFNEITGVNEVPSNPSLNRFMSTVKVVVQMAKMGGVTLSSLSDKVFMHSEMAYQGLSNLQTLAANVTGMFPRSADQKKALRLMGVAMDGLIGNALSRYSAHSTMSGWAHEAQKRFFSLNLLNAWTDANKATAAELMAAHLGEHADDSWDNLPEEIRRVLTLYDLTGDAWNALRTHAYTPEGYDSRFITPDVVSRIPREVIYDMVDKAGQNPQHVPNLDRMRAKLETSLRTYFSDRVDFAVPTPGAAQRRWTTLDTQAGTPLGEAVRMLMLFKSFPITILGKVVGRHIYGNGSMTMKHWLMNDHKGKFNLAMLMAMGTVAGYVSGAIRDSLKGRAPKPLITDGKINMETLNDAAIRGGTLGILGDVLMSDYDRNYKSFLGSMAGPILGQADTVAAMKSSIARGESVSGPAGKLLLDNAPFINLFYVRPVLDYFIIWNLEEMLNPGTLKRRESAVEDRGQEFWLRPSSTVN